MSRQVRGRVDNGLNRLSAARELMNKLLDDYTDEQVAHLLNEQGLRTGTGVLFTACSVQWARFSSKMPSFKDRLLASGMLTCEQVAAQLKVGRTTIGRWRDDGLIQGRICNNRGQWLYWLPKTPPPFGDPGVRTIPLREV